MLSWTHRVRRVSVSSFFHSERNSKHLEDLMASAPKFPIENKPGDSDILRVIETYCAGGKAGAIRTLVSVLS